MQNTANNSILGARSDTPGRDVQSIALQQCKSTDDVEHAGSITKITRTIFVQTSKVGHLIGKNGRIVKFIKEKTNTQISTIGKQTRDGRNFSITGFSSDVDRSYRIIEAIITDETGRYSTEILNDFL